MADPARLDSPSIKGRRSRLQRHMREIARIVMGEWLPLDRRSILLCQWICRPVMLSLLGELMLCHVSNCSMHNGLLIQSFSLLGRGSTVNRSSI